MKRSKFSDTQIVSILKQAEAGMPVKEIFKLNQNHTSDNLNIHEIHYLNRKEVILLLQNLQKKGETMLRIFSFYKPILF